MAEKLVSNYQPISLLPVLSKVIEKVVHEQTTTFLNSNIIFYKYQPDFRSNHSTKLFPSFLYDKILEMFWQQSLYWHDSDWPTKSIQYNKPQNSVW